MLDLQTRQQISVCFATLDACSVPTETDISGGYIVARCPSLPGTTTVLPYRYTLVSLACLRSRPLVVILLAVLTWLVQSGA